MTATLAHPRPAPPVHDWHKCPCLKCAFTRRDLMLKPLVPDLAQRARRMRP
jgi:hypothetical protein